MLRKKDLAAAKQKGWQNLPPFLFIMVREGGLEPPQAYAHYPLKVACLPNSTTSAQAGITCSRRRQGPEFPQGPGFQPAESLQGH